MQSKVAVLAFLFALGFPAPSQEPDNITPDQVRALLSESSDWYQHLTALDQGSGTSTESLLPRDNAREFAKRAMQSSFAFARAQAAVLSDNPKVPADPNNVATSTLQQSLNKASTRVTRLQDRLQTLDSRIAGAGGGPQRDALIDERTAIAADLALAKQVQTAVQTMNAFSEPRVSGRKGLLAEISRWEAINPVNDAPVDKDKPQPVHATPESNIFHPESAGIVALASKAFSFNSTRGRIDEVNRETAKLLEAVDAMRAPLRASVRAIVNESDTISNTEDNAAKASDWLDAGKKISALSARFKQLSSVTIPLGETAMSLQSVEGALNQWHRQLDTQFSSTIRYLLIRLGVLVGGVLVILLASAIWQRAILRYVTDPKRRRQLLLVKRVMVGLALAVFLTVGFLSSIGSVATLLGLVTAGLALALQNVILSAVAYFFLIGKYGLRVGDRITVQGVTGEVIQVGFIRLFMMEMVGTGTDIHPTGRLAVFANSVIFQPSALMKQAPGMDYTWHAATVTVEASSDYQKTRTRLTQAVTAVYEDYRLAIEQQHKTFEQSTDVQVAAPCPVSQAQFNEKGLEITIRYPVSLNEQPGHIDARMLDCLVAEAEKEPRLTFTAGGAPKISQVT